MNTSVKEGIELRVTRSIQAARERVFAAWITPDEIMKWFGPEDCQVLSARVHPRVGGEYHLRLKTEEYGEIELHGLFREFKQPSKLVYTWNFSGHKDLEFGESLVTVNFLDQKDATEIQIIHQGLPDEETKEDHNQGWNGCLDKLERHLTGGAGSKHQANQVVWFDIPVKDLDRAIRFYAAVLGTPLKKEECNGMTFAVFPHAEGGIGGCLTLGAEDNEPSSRGPLIYLNCNGRLDAAISAVSSNGGKVLQPRQPLGQHGFRAIVLDSEGNRVALHSM